MIPPAFIEELLARVDIVELVGRQVELKKSGANFSALCPFHAEKSPSFTVSPSKQFYHCFGCGAHGDAIRFLVEHGGLSFVEAVEELAQQIGTSIPEDGRSAEARERDDVHKRRQQSLADVLGKAAEHYRRQLKASPRAIAYLKQRGLTGDIAAHFGLGYAPEGWRTLAGIFPSYDDPLLAESGMVIVQESEDRDPSRVKRYDRFRDRIMFPIRAVSGELIGFGGRVLDRGEPKYLNSPETPVFVKGRELYGLYEARRALRERRFALVVEGYMDVVALAQSGFGNAVATLGTACTAEHVQKLLRFTDSIVFSFDGDAAGRRAANRALEASLPHASDTRTLRFLFLPPEHDPDSFVRAHGAAAFEQIIDAAVPLSKQLLHTAAEGCDLETGEGRTRLVAQARPLLMQMPAEGLLRGQIIDALAEAAKVPLDDLRRQLSAPHRSRRVAVNPGDAEREQTVPSPPPASSTSRGIGRPEVNRRQRALAPMANSLDRAVWLLSHQTHLWERLEDDARALLMQQDAPYGEFFAWLDRRLAEQGPLSSNAVLAELGNEPSPAGLVTLCARISQFHEVPVDDQARAELGVVVDRLRLRLTQTELEVLAGSALLSEATRGRQRELLARQRVLKDRLARPFLPT